jgi:hypothetical protein
MRARARGVHLQVCHEAVLEHRISSSFRSGPASVLSSYYFARNGLRFHLTWQRRHAARFVGRWVAVPAVRSLGRRKGRTDALFRLIGAADCLLGQGGPARHRTHRLAVALAALVVNGSPRR